MADKDEFIDSCQFVMNRVNENSVHEHAPHEIRKCMKDLGFKYRKVNHIAMSANSERSLVLRQKWAIALLKQKPQSKVLLNLDETW